MEAFFIFVAFCILSYLILGLFAYISFCDYCELIEHSYLQTTLRIVLWPFFAIIAILSKSK
jgi:hypothetical protein